MLMADRMGMPSELFSFGIVLGATMGGNITHLGASANIVAAGLLRRAGEPVDLKSFARIGLPFTLASTLVGYLALWWIWS
jgi:Na+/H+ antiporter NhaD/arsenite permease-like protein